MNINWSVRFKNKTWVVAFVSTILLIIQQVLIFFGVTWDYSELAVQITALIDAVFALLGLLGIVTDPTTTGISDSAKAMGYVNPAPNVKQMPIAHVAEHMGDDSDD